MKEGEWIWSERYVTYLIMKHCKILHELFLELLNECKKKSVHMYSSHIAPLHVYLKQINVVPVEALQWLKILTLRALMEMLGMAGIKSISAHMLSPWGVIRNV